MDLNTQLFDTLGKETNHGASASDNQDWYDNSYPIFIAHPFEKKEDVTVFAAFAYSWMPRIPKIKLDKVTHALVLELKDLRAGKFPVEKREALINKLVPIINNSIVGTSKFMHFVSQGQTPILDSRVAKGWESFFSPKVKDQSFPLKLFHYSDSTQIKAYLDYWSHMEDWAKNTGKTVREIEGLFFNN